MCERSDLLLSELPGTATEPTRSDTAHTEFGISTIAMEFFLPNYILITRTVGQPSPDFGTIFLSLTEN